MVWWLVSTGARCARCSTNCMSRDHPFVGAVAGLDNRSTTSAGCLRFRRRVRGWGPRRPARRRRRPARVASHRRPASRDGPCRQPSSSVSTPPSISNTRPVTCPEASEASHATTGELSSGSGRSAPKTPSVIRVRATGAIALTVTPTRPSSAAATSVSVAIPPFAAEYAACPIEPCKPAPDDVFTTRAGALPARLGLGPPVRRGVPQRREVALQVHPDHGVPLVLGRVHQHPVADETGVVHQHVERSEALDRLLHHPLRLGEVPDVRAVHRGQRHRPTRSPTQPRPPPPDRRH